MRAIAAALALILAPSLCAAQAADMIRQGVARYQDLEIEQAQRIFQQVISPASPFPVTQQQRLTAYKYLGATLSLLGQRDSSLIYFRAALFLDAFTDLHPDSFSPQERQMFGEAKVEIFKVGVQPPARDTAFDPRTQRMTLRLVTTHAGTIRAEVLNTDTEERFTVFEGLTDGIRDIPWNGTSPRGQLIQPGLYELIVRGQSAASAERRDSVSTAFEVDHRLPEDLQDTLPDLSGAQLLPERLPSSAGTRDLLSGVGLAAASVLSATIVGSEFRSLGNPSLVAVVGIGAGVWAFNNRRKHPEIPANIAANASTRRERASRNDAINRANADRISRTKLVIRPLAGTAP